MKNLTPESLKAWAREHAAQALTIAAAEAAAQVIRQDVESYSLPLLDKYRHRFDYKAANDQFSSPRRRIHITPETLEDNFCVLHSNKAGETNKRLIAEYYDRLHDLHAEHGRPQAEVGRCPALTAENRFKKLKYDLAKELKRFMGMDPETYTHYEAERELEELAMRICIDAAIESGLAQDSVDFARKQAIA